MINSCQFHKLTGDSPCQVGAGLSIHISGDENCILSEKMNGPSGIENPEFATLGVQNSWRKTSLTESQNYHYRHKPISMKNKLYQCKEDFENIN